MSIRLRFPNSMGTCNFRVLVLIDKHVEILFNWRVAQCVAEGLTHRRDSVFSASRFVGSIGSFGNHSPARVRGKSLGLSCSVLRPERDLIYHSTYQDYTSPTRYAPQKVSIYRLCTQLLSNPMANE